MHSTLTPRTNVTLICVWATALAVSLWYASPRVVSLVCVMAALGAIAGALQGNALRQNPAGFRSATTVLQIRSVLVSTSTGKWSIALLWCSFTLSLVWALLATPFTRTFPWLLAGYSAFALARDCFALPAIYQLTRISS